MIKISPFVLPDLYGFKQNGHFFLENLGDNMKANLTDRRMRMMSLKSEGSLYAIAGINTLRKGVVEAFLIPHRDMIKKGKSVFSAIRWLLESRNLKTVYPELFKVEMAVKMAERKWAEKLGFEFEGLSKLYDGQTDHFRYVRFY